MLTMLFSNKKKNIHNELKQAVHIAIDGTNLENVNVYKYLGMLLDDQLSFVNHINYLIGIISDKNYVLRKIRPYLTIETALLLVKTCILPYYDIGDIFYNSGIKSLLNKLQVLMNNSLRTVYLKPRGEHGSIDQMHADARLLKLVDRRRLHLLKVAYKMNKLGHCFLEIGPAGPGNKSKPNPANNLDNSQVNKMTFRDSTRGKLNINRINCASYERSFMVSCARLWNVMRSELKESNTTKLFVSRVKKEMLLSKLNFPE